MTLTLTPEQEAALERSVRSGRFASVDAALDAALKLLTGEEALSPEEKERRAKIRSMSLFELMQSSPLYGTEIEFERDQTPLRDLDL